MDLIMFGASETQWLMHLDRTTTTITILLLLPLEYYYYY